MAHDLEHYLAYPLRFLAKWSGQEYMGEFRNGCAAHVGWGWSLMLTASVIPTVRYFLMVGVLLYPIYREWNDAKGFNWNKKNWVDFGTFQFGNLIGLVIGLLHG